MPEFEKFPKIARFCRDMVVTEKIDGTNASVWIERADVGVVPYNDRDTVCASIYIGGVEYLIRAGSRKRFLTPGKTTDNFGFATWVLAHAEELAVGLGEGVHYGEWWGKGIQRGYGLDHKRFSLFNTGRWFFHDWPEHDDTAPDGMERAPACCHIVPILYMGPFSVDTVREQLVGLTLRGSAAAPGFSDPEGVVIYHTHANQLFKKTIGDDGHKGGTFQ